MVFLSPKQWVVPFKRSVDIIGYTNQIILIRLNDGRILTTTGTNIQISDRNLENHSVLWVASGQFSDFTVSRAIELPTGTLLLYITKWNGESFILRSTDTTYTTFEIVLSNWNGEMLFRSWSCDSNGVILAGEYTTTEPIESVILWKAMNDGMDWSIVKTFGGRQNQVPEIFHIHCVQYDPFDGGWWISTGDTDIECAVYKYDGETLTLIGGGSQHWRTVSFTFDEDFVYWCTDGTINGYAIFMRYDKRNQTYEIGQQIEGYSFVSQKIINNSYKIPLFVNESHTRYVNNVMTCSNNGLDWYQVFEWVANPDVVPYPAWNGFVDNQDGRLFAYATSILKHDTNEPFNNGTIIIDVS